MRLRVKDAAQDRRLKAELKTEMGATWNVTLKCWRVKGSKIARLATWVETNVSGGTLEYDEATPTQRENMKGGGGGGGGGNETYEGKSGARLYIRGAALS